MTRLRGVGDTVFGIRAPIVRRAAEWLHLRLHRPRDSAKWDSVVHARYRNAISFIRYSQQHRNILTVCTLRRAGQLRTLTLYMVQSNRVYHLLFQTVLVAHIVLQVLLPTCILLQAHCTFRLGTLYF